MPFSDLDNEPPPSLDWNPCGPTPVSLRDYWLVYSCAEPVHNAERDTYAWLRSSASWFGIDPPRGVIPCELFERIVFITRDIDKFATAAGAKAALQMVILESERKKR